MKFSHIENSASKSVYPCLMISKQRGNEGPNERFIILARNATNATIVMALGIVNSNCIGLSFNWSATNNEFEVFDGSVTLSND